MSERNLNPHAEARVAMALWSDRYSKQKLGCMDFYDGLTVAQKSTCAQIVDGIIYADRADGRAPAPLPISVGADPACWAAFTDAGELRLWSYSHDKAALHGIEIFPLYRQPAAPAELSVGSRWRAFEDTTPGCWGIELEQASNDDDPIMYSIKIHRERVAIVVDRHNAEVARLESLHRSEIADMAERFRSVNVERVVEQLSSSLPLSQDVINLVISAREFWDVNNDLSPESAALDRALDAFASRVPFDNDPDARLEDQP